MGMTYRQFWHEDCRLVIAYRKAYKIRQEEANRNAWLQGLYVFKALNSTPIVVQGFAKSGTKVDPYPSVPIDFSPVKPKTAQERIDEDAKARSERIKNGMMEFMHAKKAEEMQRDLKEMLEDGKKGVSKDV